MERARAASTATAIAEGYRARETRITLDRFFDPLCPGAT
ncbi:hypothetical protein P4S72_10700 [Vibrio sp. PP-XX7]